MKKSMNAQGVWAVVALVTIALVWWVVNTQVDRATRPLNVPVQDPSGVEAVNGRYITPMAYRNRLWAVPPTSLVDSGVGEDLITPLVEAKAVSIVEAKEKKVLFPDFAGAALFNGTEWLFVPEQILAWHGTASLNTWMPNVVATYGPLTETIALYKAEEGMALSRSGYLWNNNDVLKEANDSGRLFLQATGELIVWPVAGEQSSTFLETVPFHLMAFTAFEKAYPQGKVWMPTDMENIAYDFSPFGGYRTTKNIPFPLTGEWVHALPRKTLVYGVAMDGFVKAYDPALLAKENRGLLNEKVGETNYIVWTGEDGVVHMHQAGANVFKYASKGGLTDKLGYTWMVDKGTGDLVRGENRLARVPLLRGFWFFWSVLHPDTHLYANVASKGLVNGPIELKEEEGESKNQDAVKIDVDPSFGGGQLKVESVQ